MPADFYLISYLVVNDLPENAPHRVQIIYIADRNPPSSIGKRVGLLKLYIKSLDSFFYKSNLIYFLLTYQLYGPLFGCFHIILKSRLVMTIFS